VDKTSLTVGSLNYRISSVSSFGLIRIFSQIVQDTKKLRRLADKKAHICQEIDNCLRNSLSRCRAND